MASNRVGVAVTALVLLVSAGLAVALGRAYSPRAGSSPAAVTDVTQHAPLQAAAPSASVRADAGTAGTSAVARFSGEQGKGAGLGDAPASANPLLVTSPSPLATAPPLSLARTSVEVVHLHRLGSCRGRLDVTRDGVAFVSAEDGGDEAFTLKFTEFLHALSEDTLTLKSATRTYRFKTAASGGESVAQLRDLADRIAHSRR